TLNDTDEYVWENFEKRISQVLDTLFDAYPDAENNLKVNGLLLRYIDAVDFDYGKDDIFTFLKEKMKINIEIHEKLFEDTGVSKLPLGFDLRSSFPSIKPKGAVHLRFVRGKRKDSDALIWETQVQSLKDDVPKVKNKITIWVKDAHELTNDWFFKMIEGELLRRFE
ncbi:MAG: TIGR04255 family protein, partial [Methanosarcinales archaeon]